jgi:thiol-disulfide isomerase/thioredoxin
MRRSIFIFTLLLCIFGVPGIAQTSKTNLKGSISNPPRDFFILKNMGRADTVKLSKEGNFDLLIEQSSANYFTLEYNRQNLVVYLLPADVVTLQAPGINLTDAKISGSSAPYCNYLIERQKEERLFQAAYPIYKAGTLAGERYFQARDSVRNARLNALEKAKASYDFITPFYSAEKKIYNFQMGLDLINYQTQSAKMGMSVMPQMYTDFIDKLEVNDESMAYDAAYKSFTLNKASMLANQQYQVESDKSAIHYYELTIGALCKLVSIERNKSVLISELMPQIIKDSGTADMSGFIATLEGCSKDEKLIASVKKYAAQYEHLYKGRTAPDAEFYDAAGKPSKLSDYRGKVVYIDTWATWCGPCKREIPYLKTLEEEFHGKNIHFISVSTDRDVEAWKAFIAREQMSGLQLHQNEAPGKSISELYIVNSIPRFILIDEAGKIVTTDAPRPSSGSDIRNLLNSVLND